jgi:hypothetical protein
MSSSGSVDVFKQVVSLCVYMCGEGREAGARNVNFNPYYISRGSVCVVYILTNDAKSMWCYNTYQTDTKKKGEQLELTPDSVDSNYMLHLQETAVHKIGSRLKPLLSENV